MVRDSRAVIGRLLPLLPVAFLLAGCAHLRTFARTQAIEQQCIAGDELRRGEAPTGKPGNPMPVTPADSATRSTRAAAEIKCNGGLSR